MAVLGSEVKREVREELSLILHIDNHSGPVWQSGCVSWESVSVARNALASLMPSAFIIEDMTLLSGLDLLKPRFPLSVPGTTSKKACTGTPIILPRSNNSLPALIRLEPFSDPLETAGR